VGKPWMPLYVGDYLRDTQHLSTEEHGAYLLLLMECWNRGGALPGEDGQLARIARLSPTKWRRVRDTLSGFFQICENSWSHSRISAELKISADKSEKAAASADKRWKNRRGTDPEADANASPTADADAERADMRTGMRSQCQPQPHREIESSSAAKLIPDSMPAAPPVAAAGRDWNAVVAEVVEVGGLDPTALISAEGSIVEWARSGFVPELDILPVVRERAAKPGYRAPRTVGWFTPAIREQHARRTLPPPAAAPVVTKEQAAQALADQAAVQWRAKVRRWLERNREDWAWGDHDGPVPTDPRTRVPKAILAEFNITAATAAA